MEDGGDFQGIQNCRTLNIFRIFFGKWVNLGILGILEYLWFVLISELVCNVII
jgi:hypothetical protein